MLRTDGDYTIYIIEHKGSKEWWKAGDCQQFVDKNIKTRSEWEKIVFKEPFRSFSASGDCWQETSVFGTYDYDTAADMLTKIVKWNKGTNFRIVQVKILQQQKEVGRMILT